MNGLNKPLLLWVGLWIIGEIIIGIRNDLTLMGKLSSLQDTIIASLYLDLIFIPVALIFWFIMKLVLSKLGKSNILNGVDAQKNVFKIWFVFFLVIFI